MSTRLAERTRSCPGVKNSSSRIFAHVLRKERASWVTWPAWDILPATKWRQEYASESLQRLKFDNAYFRCRDVAWV